MAKTRNRSRPSLSLQTRLKLFAEGARNAARDLPPGSERDRLFEKAVANEAAANLDRWLSSPGLQRPK
jgi:hypothetical protein